MKKHSTNLDGWPLRIVSGLMMSFANALYGYDQGIMGGVVIEQSFLDVVGNPSSGVLGTAVAIFDIGAVVGAILSFFIGNMFGRKTLTWWGTTGLAVGAILQCTTYSMAQLVVGRIVAGIGIGINTSTLFPWQSEISHEHTRGKFFMLTFVIVIAGFSLSNWSTFAFSYLEGEAQWRVPIAVQFVFIFFVVIFLPMLPESPRWLAQRDRDDEAISVLARYQGKNISVHDEAVTLLYADIKETIAVERAQQLKWSDLFTLEHRNTLRRLLLASAVAMMYMLGGINAMSYYVPSIFQNALGLQGKLPRILAAVNGVNYNIAAIFPYFYVEKVGRRKILIWGAAGQAIIFAIIAGLTSVSQNPSNPNAFSTGVAAAVFLFLYFDVVGLSWVAIGWFYPSEINSLPMRTKGAALGAASYWIMNFLTVEITPAGIANLGNYYFVIYAVLNAIWVPVVYFLYPETANRRLEDIDRFFETKPPMLVHNLEIATQVQNPNLHLRQRDTKPQSQDLEKPQVQMIE